MSQCLTCEKPLRGDNRSGYCSAHHHHKGPPPADRMCECGKVLGYRNTTGRCAKCHTAWWNADPEMRERRRQGLVGAHQRPEVREKFAAATRKSWLNPEVREKRLAKMDPLKFWPKGVAAAQTPEARAKRSVSVSEAHMAWCPREYRDEARKLGRSGKRRVEVKAIIAAKVEEDGLRPLRGYVAEAADYVSRHDRCPVMRAGDGWRYGSTPKTTDDILRMARRKGWEPVGAAA